MLCVHLNIVAKAAGAVAPDLFADQRDRENGADSICTIFYSAIWGRRNYVCFNHQNPASGEAFQPSLKLAGGVRPLRVEH